MSAEVVAWSVPLFAVYFFWHDIQTLDLFSVMQRPHWIPYFDDVQAIIFLAPLAFNLMLEEDPKVNRLVCMAPCLTVLHL